MSAAAQCLTVLVRFVDLLVVDHEPSKPISTEFNQLCLTVRCQQHIVCGSGYMACHAAVLSYVQCLYKLSVHGTDCLSMHAY